MTIFVIAGHLSGGVESQGLMSWVIPMVVYGSLVARRDALAHEPGKGRGLLAVEIPLQPMTHRLVQQHAGPAGAEHNRRLAGGRGDGVEVDDRLTQGFVGLRLPGIRLHIALIGTFERG